MVRKSDDNHPKQPGRGRMVAGIESGVFENAVTTEIAGFRRDSDSIDGPDSEFPDVIGMVPDPTAFQPPDDDDVLEPGFILSERYEIVELVHSGGMGHVYKAVDTRRHLASSKQIHVAIKMMRPSVAAQLNARIALEREAARAQRLSHPNIVSIYDFDQHEGQFYLVIEWLEGESLNTMLWRTSGRALAPQFARQVIRTVAAAVQHAHEHQVVHADINPSNIFITDTQDIKLLDFGVARSCGDKEDHADGSFAWATHTYASPEVLSGSTPTIEDDVFSLGCVAYRLLGGKHPFAGASSVAAQHAGIELPRIPGLAESDWQILSRALSYDRSDRPAAASAFIPDNLAATGASVIAATPARPSTGWPILAAIAAAVAAIGATTWWLWPQEAPREPPAIAAPPTKSTTDLVEEPAVVLSETDRLLNRAAQAMIDERYLAPQGDNARIFYRSIIRIDALNPVALSGLRSISDVFVQQADAALRAEDPESAVAALAVAAETDPSNPAVAIVNELMIAQGNRHLTDARLAAASGEVIMMAEALARAERYSHIEASEINAISDSFVEQLRQQPAPEPAIAEADTVIDTSTNTSAIVAGPEDDIVETVGDLPTTEEVLSGVAIPADSGDASPDDGLLTETAVAAGAIAALEDSPLPENVAGGEVASVPELTNPQSASEAEFAEDTGNAPSEAPTSAPSETPVVNISELEVVNFVAPKFPLRAERRGETGFVELKFSVFPDGSTGNIEILNAEPGTIFNSSAENAVRQWRFAPRDRELVAQVTLRFESPL